MRSSPFLIASMWTLTLLWCSGCLAFNLDDAHVEEIFHYTGDSHYDFGYQLGQRFSTKIHQRMRLNAKLQTLLLPYAETVEGEALYEAYLKRHSTTFPKYVEELQGMADGSAVPFKTLFVANIIEEFGDSIPPSFLSRTSLTVMKPVLRCSDLVLASANLRVVAHNEDASAQDVNRTAIVIAKISDNPMFVAYTYLGDLPSGAFGFNANGIGFTLNYVEPAETFITGLGRGFISRDLLNAHNAEDALFRITRPGQASGHNYQLMDFRSQRIWNIEAASFDRNIIYEFTDRSSKNVSTFFHANQYQRLEIKQPPYQSSIHRLKRYSELTPPTTISAALVVLGDQKDRLYPVFHDALSHERGELSGWTLTTIVFDLVRSKAWSFRSNPAKKQVKLVWDLQELTVTPVEQVLNAQDAVIEKMQSGMKSTARTVTKTRISSPASSTACSAVCAVDVLAAPAKATLKQAFLILSLLPPGVYVVSGILLVLLVCQRQIQTDTENAQAAHYYLRTVANLKKIAVTSGQSHATLDSVPGRFALFLQAARENHVVNCQWCLDEQQDPDEVDHLGRSALHWAALSGSDEIVALLLRSGATINLPDTLERLTPLHYAAYYGHIKITRLLVTAGADMTLTDGRKFNPLQLAEMANLKLASVQPSHQMIIKYLRVAMKDTATPPLEHITGLTVMNYIERQIMALPQAE